MPYSYGFFDKQIKAFVDRLNPKCIFDVGPGAGKYGKLLKAEGRQIFACEVHEPYVEKFGLDAIYDRVFVQDILDFNIYEHMCGLVILGDIVEHLSVEDAQKLFAKIADAKLPAIVAVPYQYEQGESHDNPHEIHRQPDLTESLFMQRYPGFRKIFGNDKQGVFTTVISNTTIGAGLIVKNEADDLPRCLEAVREFADVVCIVDTGSTDSTMFVIGDFCVRHGWQLTRETVGPFPPKTLILTTYLEASEQDETGDWKLWDFAKARNEYVRILDPLVDWIMWMDADD